MLHFVFYSYVVHLHLHTQQVIRLKYIDVQWCEVTALVGILGEFFLKFSKGEGLGVGILLFQISKRYNTTQN